MQPAELRRSSRIYISAVVAAGLLVVLESAYSLLRSPVDQKWLMLGVLTLLSGSFTVRIPGIPARLSVSETFVFAAALLFGPPAATMTVILDTLVISFWLGRNASPPWSRLTFNVAAAAVAIWTASHVFYFFTGIVPLSVEPVALLPLLPWLLLLATVYFLLNSWLVAFVVGFQKQRSPLSVWRQSFLWLSLNYYSGASIAALILPYLRQTGNSAFVYVVGAILPVLIISYLTFKTALGRIDDANRHLSELNRLYLSTIETLAMAIDAKDQITHGHIRRVQQYAVGLAKHLGITDAALISAIEAASLLHDMGKLAVPEYILNKPGKLTPAEFDRMKLHASIGADILSAIEFPYPVVPIVRHHHENWDGSGYPDGLSGTTIPIGARILSVVDCFDALTSDRPYRPRMSDNEAIRILSSRRGTMYDPTIVDAFITIHTSSPRSLIAEPANHTVHTPAMFDQALSASRQFDSLPENGPQLDQIASSSEETIVLYDLASTLTGHETLREIGDLVSKHLRRLVPASAIVFYIYDPQSDDLVSAHAVGMHASHLLGLRVPRGERLAGWVAANKQTIINADPILDLGEVARLLKPRLRSCMCTPLVRRQDIIGVLSLYSVELDAFTDNHKRLLELIGRQISQPVHKACVGPSQSRGGDHPARFPTNHPLDRNGSSVNVGTDEPLSVVSIALIRRDSSQSSVIDEATTAVIEESVRKALRTGDILFRYSANQLVALLAQTDADTAASIGQRVRETLRLDWLRTPHGTRRLDVAIGVATTPTDGLSVEQLVRSAQDKQDVSSDGPTPPAVH